MSSDQARYSTSATSTGSIKTASFRANFTTVLHNPDSGLTLWERVERHLVKEEANGRWSLEVTPYQLLTSDSKELLLESFRRTDPESSRRNRMALDRELIQRVPDEEEVFVTIDEWINKIINYRRACFSFGSPEGEDPETAVHFYLAGFSPGAVFDWLFPWLNYRYHEAPDPEGNGEVAWHIFSVELNEIGIGFLAVEDYFRTGAPPAAMTRSLSRLKRTYLTPISSIGF
ncbi:hypothetical protein [Ensifer sp. LBL]|uniref:hypothetical protein n=1 Tax=Ensifer sp. LBL TaxID=2991056 RepID=UPI003D24D028